MTTTAIKQSKLSPAWLETITYAGTALACAIILLLTLQLWKADLRVPFQYSNGDSRGSGDAFWIYMLAKSLVDNGWFQHNPYLGMPVGMNLLDFPVTEKLHLFLMKLMAMVSGNFAVTVNLYYLFGYVLTALTMLAAGREIGLRRWTAAIVALLYATTPGHFMRGETHLFIGAIFLIPPSIMVCLWIAQGRQLIFPIRQITRRGMISILVCILSGLAYVYYAFFFALFLIVIAGFVALRRRSWQAMLEPLALVVIVGGSFLVCVAPNLLYRLQNGPNPEMGTRPANDAEVYALRIVQMVLPVPGHRIPALSRIRNEYDSGFPLVNENDCAVLGTIATVGLLILLWRIVRKLAGAGDDPIVDALALMTIVAILIATYGGFSAVFNLLIFRMIRSYNRISFFIAAFSLLTVGLMLQRMADRWIDREIRPVIFPAALSLLLIVGILDQTTSGFVPRYDDWKADFESDRDFVHSIEAAVPPDAMIYQLPAAPFPESPPLGHMADYQLFRGYLHSTHLRWSYGAMKGREIEQFQKSVPTASIADGVTYLRSKGFAGIYIDRAGFENMQSIQSIRSAVGRDPIISKNQRLLFFQF